jgi:hypothetical protein
MRHFINIVQEDIVNKPFNLRLYLTNRIKELGLLLEQLDKAKEFIAGSKDGEYILNYALKHGINDTPDEGKTPDIYYILDSNVDSHYHISDLKRGLETYLEYSNDRSHDFLKYVMGTLENVRPFQPEYFETANLLKYAEQGFANYGFVPGDPDSENDPEYTAAKRLLAVCKISALVVFKIQAIQKNLTEKLSVLQRMKNYYGDAHKYRPEHEDVETLYHATIYTNEILQNGFSAEKPIERKGVGNFGNQSLISFTHEPEVARTIMRAFKDIWMIAHGELPASKIWGWAKSEGILDDLVRAWKYIAGKPSPNRLSEPSETVQLYRLWQSFTKLRSNPVMVNMDEIIESMKNRELSDIGVLACEVKLSPGAEDEYLHAESEFRVSADRVISVKKAF